jgi:glycosyltransferase involved in cell wall biosynthesis
MSENYSTTTQPMVGIGMPTRNRRDYLKKAVDSFLAQTYHNLVVVISDNASTDGTQELCEEYAKQDKRVKYIRHKEDIGRNGNATFTLKEIVSVSDFCMMTSDDDVAEPEFIEACLRALENDSQAVMAITHHNTVYWGTSKTIEKGTALYVPTERDLFRRLRQYMLFYSHDERSFCMSGLFRKEIVEHEEFEDKYECDVNFSLRCLSQGPFLVASEKVLFHKGIVYGRKSTRDLSFGIKKIYLAITARVERIASEFRNIIFILTISELVWWQKIDLIGCGFRVIGRVLTRSRI